MTKEEIREKINSNYAIIQESLIKETFVLNKTISGLLEENEELRKRCPHEFGEDGTCIYCDLEVKEI